MRVFAGQLILVAALVVVAAWFYSWSVDLVVLGVVLAFAALATASIVGPACRMARVVTVDNNGISAMMYFGRAWSCRWDALVCALLLDVPTFGARYRFKLVSKTNGVLYVSDLIDDFDDLVARISASTLHLQPCPPPGFIERWVIRG